MLKTVSKEGSWPCNSLDKKEVVKNVNQKYCGIKSSSQCKKIKK